MKSLAFSFFLLGITSCTPLLPSGEKFTKTELYFGLMIPDGGKVTEADWDTFVAEEVTNRFPDGLTILDSEGQWKDTESTKVLEEPSKTVIILYKPSKENQEKVEAIRKAYMKQFKQQAVMRVDYRTKVKFF